MTWIIGIVSNRFVFLSIAQKKGRRDKKVKPGMNAAEDEIWNCAYCDINYDEESGDR